MTSTKKTDKDDPLKVELLNPLSSQVSIPPPRSSKRLHAKIQVAAFALVDVDVAPHPSPCHEEDHRQCSKPFHHVIRYDVVKALPNCRADAGANPAHRNHVGLILTEDHVQVVDNVVPQQTH